jgi:hypothetical protein
MLSLQELKSQSSSIPQAIEALGVGRALQEMEDFESQLGQI